MDMNAQQLQRPSQELLAFYQVYLKIIAKLTRVSVAVRVTVLRTHDSAVSFEGLGHHQPNAWMDLI